MSLAILSVFASPALACVRRCRLHVFLLPSFVSRRVHQWCWLSGGGCSRNNSGVCLNDNLMMIKCKSFNDSSVPARKGERKREKEREPSKRGPVTTLIVSALLALSASRFFHFACRVVRYCFCPGAYFESRQFSGTSETHWFAAACHNSISREAGGGGGGQIETKQSIALCMCRHH